MGLAASFCLQISRSGPEHSYTVLRGSINDTATDRKSLLDTFAVRGFGTSSDEERCPLENTPRARFRDDISLSRSIT